MIKQISNVRIKKVCTMLEEFSFEAFLINFPSSAHNPNCSPNAAEGEEMKRRLGGVIWISAYVGTS